MFRACFLLLAAQLINIHFVRSELPPFGASAMGMAGCSVTGNDFHSCFNNPAGLAAMDRFAAGTFFESRFLIPGVENKGAAMICPLGRPGNLAVSINEFGNRQMHDRTLGFSFARHFGKSVMAGVRAEWHSLAFTNDYGAAQAVTASAGLNIRITSKASLGVNLINPGNTRFNGTDEKVPASFTSGIRWEVSEHASCMVEMEKSPGLPFLIRGAVEYKPRKTFALRAGASNSFLPFSIGTGIGLGSLWIDLAAAWHPDLGITSGVSLIWSKK